jgi:hypothetical protein
VLTGVQLYVANIINGLVVTDGIPALETYVTPPVLEDLDGPRAYVWGGRMSGSRQTAPRILAGHTIADGTSGFKHLAWVVDVYIVYESNPNIGSNDTDFPQIVDAVLAAYFTTQMPIFIDGLGNTYTEPANGLTQILGIGEKFELDYAPLHTPATLRMLYYSAKLSMEVYEAVQA